MEDDAKSEEGIIMAEEGSIRGFQLKDPDLKLIIDYVS